MLIEAARRAEIAAKEMLTCINEGSASCAEAHEALEITRAFIAAGSAFQVGAAPGHRQAERHGDGGAEVLADTAGTHRSDAHSRVKTAQAAHLHGEFDAVTGKRIKNRLRAEASTELAAAVVVGSRSLGGSMRRVG